MATALFAITFWQPSEAVAAIAQQTGNLTVNTAPPSEDQIGSFTPIAGTATSVAGNTSVTRDTGPVFTANASVGDVMVGYDGSNWQLIGTVSAVADNTITLAAGAANSVTALAYAFGNAYIRPNQAFYLRWQTLIGAGDNANARRLPYRRAFRTPNSGDPSVLCDTSIMKMTLFSEINDPNSDPASPQTISVTDERKTTYAAGATPGTTFSNTGQFPLYVYDLITPFGGAPTDLDENTRYLIVVQNTVEAYEVTVGIPAIYYSQVQAYGYF